MDDTIIITGVSSFIGVHLALLFAKKRNNVIGTISQDLCTYNETRFERLQIIQNAGVKLITLNLTNHEAIKKLCREEKPSLWIHHAAWAKKYSEPDYDIKRGHCINVAPLETIYKALDEADCHGVIITGSNMEYSSTDTVCREDDACWPTTPYGLSKLTETLRAFQLSEQCNIRTRIARIFIPFGPLDAPEKLLPSVIRALKSKKNIELSPCHQSRDFLYIYDLIEGFEALVRDLDRDIIFDIFNICGGEAVKLREFIETLSTKMETDSELLLFGARPMRSGESLISYGSNAKARKILNWKPRPLNVAVSDYLEKMKVI